jgi:hypothetical protein
LPTTIPYLSMQQTKEWWVPAPLRARRSSGT